MSIGSKSEFDLLSNEELVKLSQNGDDRAKTALTMRFFNVRGVGVENAVQDKDDFFQEGMIGFLNAVSSYDSSKGVPFEAYAVMCMHRKMSTASKKNVEVPVDDENELLKNIPDSSNPLEKVILNEQLSTVLSTCEDILSKTEKAVVFLVAGGLSYDEIGERLGMSAKSVDNAVQRARRKLKEHQF